MSFSNNKCGHGKSINEHCEPCKKLYGSLDDRHELKAKLAEAIEILTIIVEQSCAPYEHQEKARAFLEKHGGNNG